MNQPVVRPSVNVQRFALFETPVAAAVLEGSEPMRAALEASIRARHAAHPGLERSNEGGWHSDTDMLHWAGEPARLLAEAAIGVARRMSDLGAEANDYEWPASMWANVSPPGALNSLHAHPGNVWAAVYYVAMGAAEGETAGALYLEDPRFPANAMRTPALRLLGSDGKPQLSQVVIGAQAGTLVVFPAWLRHGVRRHSGSGERISIAMNIDVRPKPRRA